MMEKLKVYYPSPRLGLYPRGVSEQARQVLDEELDPSIDFIMAEEMPNPADYDILVAGRPTEEQLTASPNLHTVVIPWAGVVEETLKLMHEYPHIAVHNLHHNASTTAESAEPYALSAYHELLGSFNFGKYFISLNSSLSFFSMNC